MSLPIKPVIGILADNLRLRGSVLPLSANRLTAWTKGLELPRGGEQVLYTGHMYQMMPSLGSLESMLALVAQTPLIQFMGLGRWVNRFINISAFMTWPSATEQREYDQRLHHIAQALQQSGVTFGYLYEQELYTGALIYDLGVDRVFQPHAQKVWQRLVAQGVKRVITVDPHTTEMLREVFPRVIPGYQLEVKSYLEVLAEKGKLQPVPEGPMVALHDSCVYARGLKLIDPPRNVLAQSRIKVQVPEASGTNTHCCGGPVESLFPEKTAAVAQERIEQLSQTGAKTVVAMCPICLHNLRKTGRTKGLSVQDISDQLV